MPRGKSPSPAFGTLSHMWEREESNAKRQEPLTRLRHPLPHVGEGRAKRQGVCLSFSPRSGEKVPEGRMRGALRS